MNPVKAGMVDSPSDYRWSSYFHNAQGKSDRLITSHPIYESPGTTIIDKCFSYRELFRNHLEDKQVHDIRAALNKERGLGRANFKDKIEQMSKGQTRPAQLGRPRIEEPMKVYYVL
ncbi:MAG: putative transposase [Gammaproteobacteria bacterium]|jgi:putative transposase